MTLLEAILEMPVDASVPCWEEGRELCKDRDGIFVWDAELYDVEAEPADLLSLELLFNELIRVCDHEIVLIQQATKRCRAFCLHLQGHSDEANKLQAEADAMGAP